MINKPEAFKNIHISDYDYELHDYRIAKYPLTERDQSKLLVYKDGKTDSRLFSQLPDVIASGDLLIFNNTKVIPARLKFQKSTGASIEIFCLEPVDPSDYQVAFQSHKCTWKCIVGNLKKWKDGPLVKEIAAGGKLIRIQAARLDDYKTHQHIEFSWDNEQLTFSEVIELVGVTPIPPYLNRESESIDRERYQTVYSRIKGSVAAPTAGLHFTEKLLKNLTDRNVELSELTLHVGAGTFKPVQTEVISDHEMHTEFISVNVKALQSLIKHHGNVISVGTTTLRTLESLYWLGVKLQKGLIPDHTAIHLNQWDAYSLDSKLTYPEALQILINLMQSQGQSELYATTQIMIAPGYNIRSVKALITNFHQPKSTLLLLVSAITGEKWKEIYNYAMKNDFRFLSYGDSSILYL